MITRIGVGGPGVAYSAFTAKAESVVVVPVVSRTRLGVGGPGVAYSAFTAKTPADPSVGGGGLLFRRRGRR